MTFKYPDHSSWQAPTPQPARRSSSWTRVLGLLLIAAVVAAASLWYFNVGPFKDSGVALCQDLVAQSDKDNVLTEPEKITASLAFIREAPQQLAKSRYQDFNRLGVLLKSRDNLTKVGAVLQFVSVCERYGVRMFEVSHYANT